MILLCWDKISDHNHVLLWQDFVWQHVRWVTTFSDYPVEDWKNTNVNELIWFRLLQQCNDNLALTQIPLRLSLCLPENQLWCFHRSSNNITLSSPFIYIVHVAIGNFSLVCGKIKCLSEVFFSLKSHRLEHIHSTTQQIFPWMASDFQAWLDLKERLVRDVRGVIFISTSLVSPI